MVTHYGVRRMARLESDFPKPKHGPGANDTRRIRIPANEAELPELLANHVVRDYTSLVTCVFIEGNALEQTGLLAEPEPPTTLAKDTHLRSPRGRKIRIANVAVSPVKPRPFQVF